MPDIIDELKMGLCVPVPQLRAHWGDVAPRAIAEIEKLRKAARCAINKPGDASALDGLMLALGEVPE